MHKQSNTSPNSRVLQQELQGLRVMTFNVWNLDNGPNWPKRKKWIADIILKDDADIIGLQELRQKTTGEDQMQDLAALLPAYQHHWQVCCVSLFFLRLYSAWVCV